jgi:hypothetical protein
MKLHLSCPKSQAVKVSQPRFHQKITQSLNCYPIGCNPSTGSTGAGGASTGSQSGLSEVDRFHQSIVKRAGKPEDIIEILEAIMVAGTPLNMYAIDSLLGKTGAVDVIMSLSRVLQISAEDTVTFQHSFSQFLVNRAAADKYYIDIVGAHELLAKGCLRVMKDELRFNICDLKSSHLRNRDVPEMQNVISSSISNQLQYASVHWAGHVIKSNGGAKQELLPEVQDLIKNPRLLYWLEVMSAIQRVPKALSSCQDMKDWVPVSVL